MAFSQSKAGKVYNALLLRSERVVTAGQIREACKLLRVGFKTALAGMSRAGALEPVVFKGIYYLRNRDERDLGVLQSDALEVIASACNSRLGNVWYFGLDTALKLSEEQSPYRSVSIVSRERVKRGKAAFGDISIEFRQLKGVSFERQVRSRGALRFSEPGRTLIDFAYFGARRNASGHAKKACEKVFSTAHDKRFLFERTMSALEDYPRLYRIFLRRFFEQWRP